MHCLLRCCAHQLVFSPYGHGTYVVIFPLGLKLLLVTRVIIVPMVRACLDNKK